jgi:glutaminase
VSASPGLPSSALLAEILDACAGDDSGEVPDGVPALQGADHDHLGVCVVDVDGGSSEAGHADAPFCIQSIAKAFTYGLALADRGIEAVDGRIDLEPSGEAYNEISLHAGTGHPSNPLINAGALVAAALVDGGDVDGRTRRILEHYAALAGRELPIADEVLALEQRDPWRNVAIASLLREYGILEEEPSGPVEIHARQSAVTVDCRALARMGAVLAARGLRPGTGDRLLPEPVVRRVLAVMATCGMYDDAGRWMADVGLPAKSGVGGGILAVVPGRMAIAVLSPRLDRHGASVRGGQVCRRLSLELGLHVMCPRDPAATA